MKTINNKFYKNKLNINNLKVSIKHQQLDCKNN